MINNVKRPLFLSDFHEASIFSKDFRKKITPISKFMKIRLVGAELLKADGQMDKHDEANSRLSQYSETSRRVPATRRASYSSFIVKTFLPIRVAVGVKFNIHPILYRG
jgi:hypothetical protein